MTFPNTAPGEGPSPKESWHSALASVRFRVKAVVSGVSPETTAADDEQACPQPARLALALRDLRERWLGGVGAPGCLPGCPTPPNTAQLCVICERENPIAPGNRGLAHFV